MPVLSLQPGMEEQISDCWLEKAIKLLCGQGFYLGLNLQEKDLPAFL